jgi:GTPase SAR1 family protein
MVQEVKTNEHLCDAHLVLIGNKIDKSDDQRQVSSAEAKQFATSHKIDYFEVSARNNIGVHRVFEGIAAKMMEVHSQYVKRVQDQKQITIMLNSTKGSQNGEDSD